MAVLVDVEGIDLVIEPHVLTESDRQAFRQAVKAYGRDPDRAKLAEQAHALLTNRHRRDQAEAKKS